MPPAEEVHTPTPLRLEDALLSTDLPQASSFQLKRIRRKERAITRVQPYFMPTPMNLP